MCTLYTFDRKFYNENKSDVVQQIIEDSLYNSEGCSMLMLGSDETDSTLIRTMNVDLLLDVLETQFKDLKAQRCWIHLRMATTAFVGLNGCHGFAGKNYSVFHNGVLARPESEKFNVDSELIAHDIQFSGIKRALDNLAYDTYANVLLVNNETGIYHVTRRTGGTLFTDGEGNYSTNELGAICQAVPDNSQTTHDDKIVIPRISKYAPANAVINGWSDTGMYSYYNPDRDFSNHGYSLEEFDETEYNSKSKKSKKKNKKKSVDKTWGGTWESDEYRDDLSVEEIVESVLWARNREDFLDLCEFHEWVRQGLPTYVRENLNMKQIQWCIELGFFQAGGAEFENADSGDVIITENGVELTDISPEEAEMIAKSETKKTNRAA